MPRSMPTRWRTSASRLSRSRGLLIAAVIVVVLILTQIVLQIVGAVVADRGITRAAYNTYTYVGDLMSERVAEVADDASDVVIGTASEISRYGGVPEPDALVAALASRLTRETSVATVFVGTPDGRVLAVGREQQGYSLFTIVPADGEATLTVTTYGEDLSELGSETSTIPYVLGDRPWYALAVEQDGVSWTEPYVSRRSGEIVVSPAIAARPVGDPDAEPLAIVGADLDLDRLAALLDDIPIGADASAFILTHDRRVVAAPQGARDTLNTILEETGDIPTADQIGLPEPDPNASSDGGDLLTVEEAHVSLERELDPETGLDWTLRLESDAEELTPGVASFKSAAAITSVVSLILLLVAAALAMRMWRPVRAMRSRASTDALTGLANRYEFERQGSAMLARAQRRGAPILVVAFDLDDFKRLNDAQGHDAGDRALRAVGRALRAGVRTRDIAARLGGDEFAAILLLNEASDPAALAERLRASAESAARASSPFADGLGVTAGYATAAEGGYERARLLAAADDALVAGKAYAKGRVYAAGEPTVPDPADSLPADSGGLR